MKMFKLKRTSKVLIVVVVLIVSAILSSIPFYYQDMKEVKLFMENGANKMDSPYGTIEYLDLGEGKPILLSHGTMGGHDHGLLMAQKLIGDGYRVIIPSRFGYLNSEIPDDPSFEKQADSYAYLIEQLGLDEVVVAGMSAGSVPATLFAINHPEKTEGLILISSITYVPKALSEPQSLPVPEIVYETVLNNDYLFWCIYKLSPATINSLFGASKELTSQINQEEREFVDAVSRTFLPVSKRYAGWLNDSKKISQLNEMNLESIDVPTLVISAKNDNLAPHSWSEYLSGRIHGARLVTFESGGHVLLGHTDEVKELSRQFIRDTSPLSP